MKQDYLKLIRLLAENQPCSVNSLANLMGLSARTIKNYVHDINVLFPDAVQSSRNGYSITRNQAIKIMESAPKLIPQNSDERIAYILNRLFHNDSDTAIDVYELCEELYVSIPTLNSELKKIRRKLADFDLQLIAKMNTISIHGAEKNKRRLLSDIIYNESNVNFVNLSTLQNEFADIDVDFIQQTVSSIFQQYRYYINDYSLTSLVLHITISIDRIRNNNVSIQETASIPPECRNEYELTCDIVKQIESRFSITYNQIEIYELTLLIVSRATSIDYFNIGVKDIDYYINKDYLALASQLVDNVLSLYNINLESKDFLVRFSLHLQGLVVRSRNNYYSKNPLTQSIKLSCPLIYDVAVSLAAAIKKTTGISINDDEIAYIAVHLGSSLEEQRKKSTRLTAALYYPNYYDMVQKITDDIQRCSNNQLFITHVLTNESQISSLPEIDLLLSILPVTQMIPIPFVQIQPFLTENDRTILRQKIDQIKAVKKQEEFNEYLRILFKPDLFEVVDGFPDEHCCIKYMAAKYMELGYTDSNFVHEVLEREQMSSTAFGDFAIPHAINMNANKTAMNVIVSKKPIPWGDTKVSLVIMMCFNKDERHIFKFVFEPIAITLRDNKNMQRIVSMHSYEDFIRFLSTIV